MIFARTKNEIIDYIHTGWPRKHLSPESSRLTQDSIWVYILFNNFVFPGHASQDLSFIGYFI